MDKEEKQAIKRGEIPKIKQHKDAQSYWQSDYKLK